MARTKQTVQKTKQKSGYQRARGGDQSSKMASASARASSAVRQPMAAAADDGGPHVPFYGYMTGNRFGYFPRGDGTYSDEEDMEDAGDGEDIPDVAKEQCFGYMRGEIVGLRYYTGEISRGEMVQLSREPMNQYDANAVRVDNSLGDKIGHIKREQAKAIAAILDANLARIEGRVPTNKNTFSMGVDLAFYGPPQNAEKVKAAMKKHGYPLSDHGGKSGGTSGQFEPQDGARTDAMALAEFSNYTSVTKTLTTDELDKELDKVFENLRDEDKKLYAEPANLIGAKLFPHQKQALAWMMKREKGDELPPFWNEEENRGGRQLYKNTMTGIMTVHRPEALCGGILADDMGLGKTLEVIALIASHGIDGNPMKLRNRVATKAGLKRNNGNPKKRKRITGSSTVPKACGSPAVSSTCEKALKKLRDARNSIVEMASNGKSCDGQATSATTEQAKEDFCGKEENNSTVDDDDSDNSDVEFLKSNSSRQPQVDGEAASGGLPMPAGKVDTPDDDDIEEPAVKRAKTTNRIESDDEDTDDKSVSQTVRLKRAAKAKPQGDNGTSMEKVQQNDEDPWALFDDSGFSNLIPETSEKDFEFESPDDDTNQPRGTLIICPMSVMQNWEEQIEQHFDPAALPYLQMHRQYGNKLMKTADLRKMDVVITTYQTMTAAWKRKKDPLFEVEWLRVVLDEAHMIRNPNSQMAKAACELKARRRWALTGTPIQNKLLDLWSIVKFLRIKPLEQRVFWRQCIERPISQRSTVGIRCIRALMKATAMRRTKNQEIEPGKPLVDLPPRIMTQETLEFSEDERALYDTMLKEGRLTINKYIRDGTLLRHYAHVLAILMRLRQLCCHPYLVRKAAQKAFEMGLIPTTADGADGDKDAANRTLAQTLLQLISAEDAQSCPVCLENPPVHAVMNPVCKHYYCRECINEWIRARPNAKCPMCRGVMDPRQFVEQPQKQGADDNEDMSNKPDEWQTSVKVHAVMTHLLRLRQEDSTIKSIVVSQFTSFLDVIETPLMKENFNCVRLDGTMDAAERIESVRSFQNKDPRSPTIFLLSLKAGGVGINLTAATKVFLMDPAWNPACEEQCFDRCHRLGQTKEVTIVKFLVGNSIEERMLELQEKKRMLMAGAFGAGKKRDVNEFIKDVRTLLA